MIFKKVIERDGNLINSWRQRYIFCLHLINLINFVNFKAINAQIKTNYDFKNHKTINLNYKHLKKAIVKEYKEEHLKL